MGTQHGGNLEHYSTPYVPNPMKDGYLRKVTDVQITGSQLVAVTDRAALEDAIKEGRFSALLDFTGHQGSAVNSGSADRNGNGVIPMPPLSVDLSGKVLYDKDGVKIDIPNGTVVFTPQVEIDMLFDWLHMGFTSFKCTATGDINANFDIRASADALLDESGETCVGSIYVPFVMPPVAGVAVFDFYAGFDANATIEGSLTAGFDSSSTVTIGADYEDGVWNPIAARDQHFNQHSPQGEASGQLLLRGYVRPQLRVLFFDCVGPQIDAKPYLEFTGYGQSSPPCVTYQLAGGLTSTCSIMADIFGYHLTPWQATLLDIRVPFYNGQFGQCGGGSLDVNQIQGPASLTENIPGSYSITASGDTGIKYKWSCAPPGAGSIQNPTGPSITFTPYSVDADTQVTIRVDVSSDNSPP